MNKIIQNKGLECLAVIGSHARGDDDIYSDIDLLGVVKDINHEMVNVKKVNLAIYSEHYLRQMMRGGDLFALHIVKEGVPLVNNSLFQDLCDNFKYKGSYKRNIQTAYLMGEMILSKQNDIINWEIVNKRIAWCVRTYILSIMAENRTPMFSKENIALYGFSVHDEISYQDFLSLINAKQRIGYSPTIMRTLERFLSIISKYKPSDKMARELYRVESILKNTFDKMTFDLYR